MDILPFLSISPFGDSQNSPYVLGETHFLQVHSAPFPIPIIPYVISSSINYPIVQRDEPKEKSFWEIIVSQISCVLLSSLTQQLCFQRDRRQ